MTVTATFGRYVIDADTSEKQLQDRSGQRVTVTPLEEDKYDRNETGPMFRIAFGDGYSNIAFVDELSDWEGQE